ncbi:hypothetical protein F7725_028538 [Dissostichus mawsoni]|uniref:Hydantoinase B/oxoprolinase domain-containing protein n=1 Tax=Dissostichus mawsoni TaxID=36200 RepID=A0A7J5XG91_DISMA|nr:hypothetical protein F7725_028538 [Dissostichus mawsoni]
MTVGSDPHCALGTELNTERLDFSCAVFGPDGGLVSNAPHIPVHLGAMQETVQFQIRSLGNTLKEGDVILSNHPGHHADIGGITPGSMPPHSTSLQQEGAVFISFKLVTGGVFQEEAVTEALMAPAQYPESSGTRNLHDNLSDLRAQVAANRRGSQLSNAELAVRDMLRDFARRRRQETGSLDVEAEDFMDDGTAIRLRGCLAPVKVVIPPGSILQPSQNAAVVGETCSHPRECESVGYYETVAGGAGAGPGWRGRSGVHRGAGKYCGGDGVVRKLLFRNQVVLSSDGRVLNLGGKTSVSLQPGDMFCLYTPGGGGYGREGDTNGKPQTKRRRLNDSFPERGSVFEYRMAQEGV